MDQIYNRCDYCPIQELCMLSKKSYETCVDFVNRYNNGLTIPLDIIKQSPM